MALDQLRASAGQAVSSITPKRPMGWGRYISVQSSSRSVHAQVHPVGGSWARHTSFQLFGSGGLEMLPKEGGAGWSHWDAACTACAGESIQTTAQIQGQGRSAVSKAAALRFAWGSLPADNWLVPDFVLITQADAHVRIPGALFLSKVGQCDFVDPLLATVQCISLVEQMNL